jgi:hypothetical protein
VNEANSASTNTIDDSILDKVLEDLRSGKAFPTLESAYQRAIGDSSGRQLLLHLLAEQTTEESLFTDEIGRVVLKKSRQVAEELDIQFIDQLILTCPSFVEPFIPGKRLRWVDQGTARAAGA